MIVFIVFLYSIICSISMTISYYYHCPLHYLEGSNSLPRVGLGLSLSYDKELKSTHQLELLLVFQDQDVTELFSPYPDKTNIIDHTRVGKKVQHLILQITSTQAV